MAAQLLHLLLIAALGICPLVCDRGICCPVEQPAAASCCSHCHDDCDPQKPQPPADRQPCGDSGDNCQCLCGGAVLQISPADELLRAAADIPVVASIEFSQPAIPVDYHPPDTPLHLGDLNVGRMICCLHMLLLC